MVGDLPEVLTCNYSGVDWTKIRRALAKARERAGFDNPSVFSEKTGFDKSLAYRIEKGTVQPSLDTIETWLKNTTQEQVGAFLMRVLATASKGMEQKEEVSHSVTEQAHNPAHPQRSEAPDAAVVVVEGSAVSRADLVAEILEHLQSAIGWAAEITRAGGSIRSGDEAPPERSGSHPVSRRKTAAGVRRLK